MRYVLRSHSEVCHYWANEKQEQGKSGNMFFEDKTIYSYGKHFPIARHENEDIILFTTRKYSVSTSSHIAYTRNAIPSNKTVIKVHDVIDTSFSYALNDNGDHIRPLVRNYFVLKSVVVRNLIDMKNEIVDLLKKSTTARTRGEYYLASAFNNIESMQKYLELREFAFEKKELKEFKGFIDHFKAGIQSGTVKEEIEKQIEREKQEGKARQEKLEKENKENIEAWKKGKNVFLPHLNQAFCRINLEKEIVETSQGANVTIKEAQVLWSMIKNGRDIIGHKLSGYTVIGFNGELKIGCHKIDRAEVERIGALLETINH